MVHTTTATVPVTSNQSWFMVVILMILAFISGSVGV